MNFFSEMAMHLMSHDEPVASLGVYPLTPILILTLTVTLALTLAATPALTRTLTLALTHRVHGGVRELGVRHEASIAFA